MSSSDLLDHFKLDAEIHPDYTLHTSWELDRTLGRQKEKIETKWYRKRCIGYGMFGEVWLETCGEGTMNQRAVKILSKPRMNKYGIDYTRELIALAKFSKLQVWIFLVYNCSSINSQVYPHSSTSKRSSLSSSWDGLTMPIPFP